ncbi:MAG: bifunctional phosphoglucose/phosphomannose isomerase [Actinomycetia bacterium]|nr:bifunctional phosphoglucose/phosphomannose isomerase [Actinomycetes bacterium]
MVDVPGDTTAFLASVEGLPEQLASAHEAAGQVLRPSALPAVDAIDSIAVLAVGSSAIAGEVLTTVAAPVLPVPVTLHRQYRLPAFVGPRTLVFAVSYSGEDEETLVMTADAFAAGARVVSVSNGGALAALSERHGGLHVHAADGLASRTAIGALVAPLIVAVFGMGLFPEGHAMLVRAQEQLARRRDACRPDIEGAANPAREVARKIGRTIPLVYGAGSLGRAAAMRWKADVNENAKAPAFWNSYPDLAHDEISGWGQHGDVTRQIVTVVELRHGLEPESLNAQIAATHELIREAVHDILEVEARGEGRLAQVLDLMYLGDWVSCYLALQNDVDPGPTDARTALQEALNP